MTTYKSYTLEEATAKLMRFCTYRERCHKEVKEKLNRLHMIPEAQEVIIARLINDNFLNEERFAKVFVRDKFKLKKWGRYRLKRELKYRNISDYLIDKALQEIDQTAYRTTFQELFDKRLQSISETHPFKIKKKISDYLFRKGYESELIYERLEKL